VAFADGCQDTSLYVYQIDRAKSNMFGPIAGVVIFGYRMGMFFAKSASLYLAHYCGWNNAYFVMAFLVSLGIIFTLCIRELRPIKTVDTERIEDMVTSYRFRDNARFEFVRVCKCTIFECLICPFKLFMGKNDWKKLIALVVLYKSGDILAQKMAKPFYVDIGLSILEIANEVQFFGTVAALIGGVIGGYLIKRNGLRKIMLLTLLAHAASCFCYVVLSIVGRNLNWLYATVFVENVTGGAMGTAFIAFLYGLCNRRYAATQYALLWAFYDFGGMICRITSGILADLMGWTWFFLFVPLVFIPSTLILYSTKTLDRSKKSTPKGAH
jgi:PAT family beta-lactamase induction signal transducer AmpG